MAIQAFMEGSIRVSSILGVITGVSIAAIIELKRDNSFIRLAAVFLAALAAPIVLIGLIVLAASVLSLVLPAWTMFVVYVAGFLTILFLLLRFNNIGNLFQAPEMDERNFLYCTMSGFAAFIFLNFLIIGSLLQESIHSVLRKLLDFRKI